MPIQNHRVNLRKDKARTEQRSAALSASQILIAKQAKKQILKDGIVGNYKTPASAYGVALSGNYACVADGNSGLQIIDISDPTHPLFVSSYAMPGAAGDVVVRGQYAYVNDTIAQLLLILDISNPANPVLTGSYRAGSIVYGVAVSDNYAYLANDQIGLTIVDISNPATPTFVGNYNTPGWSTGVAISGNYAYVADQTSGLQILNIANPANPTWVGSYSTPIGSVLVSGNYAYLAAGDAGLLIVNISNPANPTLVGSYNTPGSAIRMAINGNYVYLGDYNAGLQIIDVSNPANPTSVGSYDTPGLAWGVAINGDYAYVCDETSGLEIINTTIRADSAPVVVNPMTDQSVIEDQPFDIIIPDYIFMDPDQDPLTFDVKTETGEPLPNGMSFNKMNNHLTGKLSQSGTSFFSVIAKDPSNAQAQSNFAIKVSPAVSENSFLSSSLLHVIASLGSAAIVGLALFGLWMKFKNQSEQNVPANLIDLEDDYDDERPSQGADNSQAIPANKL